MKVTTTCISPLFEALINFVPDPKGPDCKTDSSLSDSTIETILLHGQKESAVLPGDTEQIFYTSTVQAKLAG